MRCRSSGKSTRPYQSSTYSEINDKLEWIINTMDTILLKAKKINVDFCKRTCFNLSIISNVYLSYEFGKRILTSQSSICRGNSNI